MRLNKVAQSYYYANEGVLTRSPAFAERMAALLDGRNVNYSEFDAKDDQTAVLNRRIAVLFPSHKCVQMAFCLGSLINVFTLSCALVVMSGGTWVA